MTSTETSRTTIWCVRVSDERGDTGIVSEHRTERAAWTACNRFRREMARIWGHKLYGPRFHVIDGTTGDVVAMYDLDKRYRRARAR